MIGYFKLCKPNLASPIGGVGGFGHNNYYSNGPQYSPAGLGVNGYGESHHHHYGDYGNGYYGREQSGGVAFKDDSTYAQKQAYQGWAEYRSNKDKEAAVLQQ